jgi:hypothetical protein
LAVRHLYNQPYTDVIASRDVVLCAVDCDCVIDEEGVPYDNLPATVENGDSRASVGREAAVIYGDIDAPVEKKCAGDFGVEFVRSGDEDSRGVKD